MWLYLHRSLPGRGGYIVMALAIIGIGLVLTSGAKAAPPAVPWVPGDVFVGVNTINAGDPAYLVFASDGTPKGSLAAQPGDTGAHAGCAFAPNGNLYTTNADTSVVTVYDGNDPHAVLTTVPTTAHDGGQELESIIFAGDGNFLVGHADNINHNLAEYTPAGSFVRSWSPATESKGIDWIDLASDQHTVFYTSEGSAIKRYDITGAGTQLADFTVLQSPPAPGENFAFRLLPPGDSSGGLLVAETSLADHRFGGLLRLGSNGQISQTYNLSGGNPGWFALNRDPNGTSFWSATTVSGQVYRFGINSGLVEVGPIDASQGGRTNTVRGLCVKGEITAGGGTPTPTPPPGVATPTATPPGVATPTPPPPAPSPTPCGLQFSDVQPSDYFYAAVEYLACQGVVSGYADGTFRPYANTTRSQMLKIVVLGFGMPIHTPPAGGYTFSDVPPSNPFFAYVETGAAANVVSGYACGGPGEPCDPAGRPYFRPYGNVTRGQLSKIDVVAAGWPLQNPPAPTFIDVPPGSAFYPFVETAVCHGVISGYGDGTFRPGAGATRGQIAKIVYLSITAGTGCSGPGARAGTPHGAG